mmetsp:Transcript_16750/g.32043  ORF Transcript_16750/g.32043 Transcript_16750/m.32043 type:complete len:91 (+) Transcript_16750:119-391(+)
MDPSCTTAILSALRMVDSRWAMTMVVMALDLSAMSASRACCTTFSLWLSRALVASSRSRILGRLTRARAMATRCFCPPDMACPPSPTGVW